MDIGNVKKELKKIENLWEIVLDTNYLRRHFGIEDLPEEFEKKDDDFNIFIPALNYLLDLLDVVFRDYGQIEDANDNVLLANKFSMQISLLQAIFVQQDMINEMFVNLTLKNEFERKIKNSDYRKLRLIRNKLIGHPISRDRNDKKLDSVALIGLANKNPGIIEFVRYDRSNKFKIQLKDYPDGKGKNVSRLADRYEVTELQEMHLRNLKNALEIITLKLDTVFRDYLDMLEYLKKELSLKVDLPDFNQKKIGELVSDLGVKEKDLHYLYNNQGLIDNKGLQKIINRLQSWVEDKMDYILSLLEDKATVSNSNGVEEPFFESLGWDDDLS